MSQLFYKDSEGQELGIALVYAPNHADIGHWEFALSNSSELKWTSVRNLNRDPFPTESLVSKSYQGPVSTSKLMSKLCSETTEDYNNCRYTGGKITFPGNSSSTVLATYEVEGWTTGTTDNVQTTTMYPGQQRAGFPLPMKPIKNKLYETIKVAALLLPPDALLRFKPLDEVLSWNKSVAMQKLRLVFTAWDGWESEPAASKRSLSVPVCNVSPISIGLTLRIL